jgi:hypothetical protein
LPARGACDFALNCALGAHAARANVARVRADGGEASEAATITQRSLPIISRILQRSRVVRAVTTNFTTAAGGESSAH